MHLILIPFSLYVEHNRSIPGFPRVTDLVYTVALYTNAQVSDVQVYLCIVNMKTGTVKILYRALLSRVINGH